MIRSPRRSSWRRLGVAVAAVIAATCVCEAVLRVLWHNPYRHELPDHVLKLPFNHPRTDHVFDRSKIGANPRTVRFRTDSRSYILPSDQYRHPQSTVVFLGGSTTACEAVQEPLRFPA